MLNLNLRDDLGGPLMPVDEMCAVILRDGLSWMERQVDTCLQFKREAGP